MDPKRWKRIDEIFHAALDREPSDRAVFLAEACQDDDLLLTEVQELLASHEKESSLFEKGIQLPKHYCSLCNQPLPEGMTECPNCSLPTIDSPSPGSPVLSGYRTLSLLGKGGMGRVYLAEDEILRRHVAIKILPENALEDDHARARFLREARAMANIEHPNVVRVYSFGESQG
jgi:hypothetical protein